MTIPERDALDELMAKRRCPTRGDLVRLYLEADYNDSLLMVDDALHNLATVVGQAIGGVVAQMAADAEYNVLKRGLGG